MEFFSSAVTSLSTVVVAIGAGVGVWGIITGRTTLRQMLMYDKEVRY